ncbi:hypothetical protein KM295_16055 [Natronomonas sp. F2-12]|uniref:CARDB domain-containing protein n=1 Tax=Natronomonas aquatica TaxID=2841590 RepID=A0A9R1CWW1_9EURY|nr:hypothetical protein [Natronomonas aquatica]MCQ4334966.1 hypothetical protein [Natronomonas aquatica]
MVVVIGVFGVTVSTAPIASANSNLSGISVSPNDPVTGEQVTVEVEINNLESASGPISIERVSLRKSSDLETYQRVQEVGSVGPGGSISVPLTTSFETAGEKQLEVSVLIEEPSGATRGYEYPVSIDVSELRVRTDLSATTADNRSTTVTLENVGNVNTSEIELTGTVGDDTLDTRYLAETEPGTSRSVTFDTDGYRGEAVTFNASYVAEGERYTTDTTHTVKYSVPGEVRLTSVEMKRTGSGVLIDGDAANVGGTDAQSVLVSVEETDSVRPVSPSGDYYLGTIETGEFSTFELTAEVGSETDSIPVEVTYIVDTDQVTTTQRVPIEATSNAGTGENGDGSTERNDSSGELPGGIPPIAIGVGVALLVAIIGVGLYRRRDT